MDPVKLRGGRNLLLYFCIVLSILILGLYITLERLDDSIHRIEKTSIEAEKAAKQASKDLSDAIDRSRQPNPQLARTFEAIFYIEAILKQEFGEVTTTTTGD